MTSRRRRFFTGLSVVALGPLFAASPGCNSSDGDSLGHDGRGGISGSSSIGGIAGEGGEDTGGNGGSGGKAVGGSGSGTAGEGGNDSGGGSGIAGEGGNDGGGGNGSGGDSGAGMAGAAGSPPDCIELRNCENPAFSPLVASGDTTCIIGSDAHLRCWGTVGFMEPPLEPLGGPFTQLSGGMSSYGGLGASTNIATFSVGGGGTQPGNGFVQVALFNQLVLGLRADGTVQGWGDGAGLAFGWRGPIDGTARFKRVFAGDDTACGLHANGAATCWKKPHVSLGVGGKHACRANVDGTLECWGDDALGQASPPVGGNFVSVSTGAEHSCALKATGEPFCWGANTHGESTPIPGTYYQMTSGKGFSCANDFWTERTNCWGELPFPESAIPQQPTNLGQLAAGDAHVCEAANPVTCFGDNSRGQSSPPPNTHVLTIAAGSAHTCGILLGTGGTTVGEIICWGDNSDGQSTPPDGVYIAIVAGARHTCALDPTGQIVCWGKNDRGQASAPSGQFVALAAGGSDSCGVSVTGNTVCWGDSALGQLRAPPPPTFKELALGGGGMICGIRSDDTRFCSNANASLSTVPEPNLHGFEIGDDDSQTGICALRPDHTAVCWGDARDTIFGDARAMLHPPPGEFDYVSVGYRHACGLRPNRTVVCWGLNYYGQMNVPADLAGP